MATTQDFVIRYYPSDILILARKNARIRIEKGEYARDKRLSTDERIEKVVIGYIGEYGFKDWCEEDKIDIEYLGEIVGTGPDRGDFKSKRGLIIDVKTQDTPYIPKSDWRCEVTDEQISRPTDLYVFCKLRRLGYTNILYLVGWMHEEEFKLKAIYRQKGTILKGKTVHYPKWDVTIDQLYPLSSLKNEL